MERRFFLLDVPLSATETPSFMCRVVVSKTSPLDAFAPYSLEGALGYRSNDIVPSILPEPTLSKSRKDFLSQAREKDLFAKLSGLLSINLSNSVQQSRTLESELVKCYKLPHPEMYFKKLMENEEYARDVHTLLKKVSPRHAYLVTGFLTATKSRWTIEDSSGVRGGMQATVPAAAVAAVPIPGLGDLGSGFSGSNSAKQYHERAAIEEEIFAVSYSPATFSSKIDWSKGSLTREPVLRRPKQAKAHHLAMAADQDDDDGFIDCESDREDDVAAAAPGQGNKAPAQDLGVAVILDTQHIPNEDDGHAYIDFV